MNESTTESYFHETQRFRQPWLWGLLLAVAVVVGGSLYPGGVSDAGAVVGLTVVVAVLALFAVATLTTAVRDDGISVRFFPFHLRPRHVPIDAIERVEAVEYSPIGEYGGWGVRWSADGWAYNVSGSDGVRIERQDGKPLLIGSQRADELAAAIERARQ
ncbi:Protein of unknown function [Natronoarchaeum philippinense]|uniref:Uncharacterized protein n=1 Tax=Natronoarchaeum philippinense TaxID=558529 RepID=A0A285N4P7_NATPI|nr:DUF3093 family protein [Natronoarchaeum philippinense]SNZ04409.1 Protein of unknown function [Natronoarchaeum philippinense]